MRCLCQRLPGEEQDRGATSGHRHGAGGGAPRRRAKELAVLRLDTAAGPGPPASWVGERFTGSRAALRVLRGLCGVRRDALCQARVTTLRRPDRGRQRDRLLLDLRRQPTDHPLDRRSRRARAGVEQLPLRGHRRVRDGHAHGPRGAASPPGWTVRSSGRPTIEAPQDTELQLRAQRQRVADLEQALEGLGNDDPDVPHLLALAGDLVSKGVWIIGGDGWAYDIGFGGLDHVLASGRNVNIMVLDTEVYSNTGGQASNATPRGAVAKFASSGKATPKNDLGALAMAYGTAYVAQIALGANDTQTVKALLEANAWPGPSLVIAYSTCTAHGMDMSKSMEHMKDAVRSGYWPLYRFQPTATEGGQPFRLDSRKPSIPVRDFVSSEARFAILSRTHPQRSERLLELIQADVDERWRYYEQLAAMSRKVPSAKGGTRTDADSADSPQHEEDPP